MKHCPRCDTDKPLEDFIPAPKRADGVSSYCRPCFQEYRRSWDKANWKKRKRERRVKAMALVREAKSVPCMDCDIQYPYYVMDFDHREDEDKVQVVSKVANQGTLKQLREEIAKCDVVCSNCHRARTFQRLGVA